MRKYIILVLAILLTCSCYSQAFWISRTLTPSCYHNDSTCRLMRDPRRVGIEECQSMFCIPLRPCQRCMPPQAVERDPKTYDWSGSRQKVQKGKPNKSPVRKPSKKKQNKRR